MFEPLEWTPTVYASGNVKLGIPTDRSARLKYLGWKTKEACERVRRLQGLPDDFASQHFKAKASCVPLYRFDQSVQGLGVGIGDGMIEIGKDRFIPVAYSSQQWLKSSFQVRRDAGFPVLIGGFCLFTVAFLPDIEKALFEPVGGFQIRKVLRPAFQD